MAQAHAVTKKQTKQPPAQVLTPEPRPEPVLNLRRSTTAKARESDITLQTDGHKCVHVEFWLKPEYSLEDALAPEFWSQVAYKFQRAISTEGNYAGSIIEVRTHDLTMYARLFVRAVQKRGLVVHLLDSHYIGLQELKSDRFEARWNAQAKGYDIIRKLDKEVIGQARDFQTKDQVQAWLDRNAGGY